MAPLRFPSLDHFLTNRDVVSVIAVFGLMLSYILFYCVLFLAAVTFLEVSNPVVHQAEHLHHHHPIVIQFHHGSGDGPNFPVNWGQDNIMENEVPPVPDMIDGPE
jgi:hypothetical protein